MKLIFRYLCFLLLLGCCFTASIAATTTPYFDLQQSNATLTKISDLTTSNIKVLENAINTLTKLQTQAKGCVNNAQAELDTINIQIQAISPISKPTNTLTTEQHYLQNKKDQLTNRISDCRLFLIRSEETIEILGAHAHQLATNQLFEAEPNLVAKISANVTLVKHLSQQFNQRLFYELSGLAQINATTAVVFLLIMTITLAVGLVLRRALSKRIAIRHKETPSAFFLETLFAVLKIYIIGLLVLIVTAIYMTAIGLGILPLPYLVTISYALLLYPLILIILRMFFYPPAPAHSLSNIPHAIGRVLILRLRLLMLLLLIAFICYTLFHDQAFPEATILLLRSLFITLLAINLIRIVWLVNRMPKLISFHPALRNSLSFLLGMGLIIIIAAEWIGYHGIAIYLLKGIGFSLLCGFSVWLFYRIIIFLLHTLSKDQHPWQQHLHLHLGIKKHEPIPEVMWLQATFFVVVWSCFIVLLLRIWGLSTTRFNQIINAIVHGFLLLGVHLYPLRILLGMLLFTALITMTRLLHTRVARHPGLAPSPGAREALAAIVNYAGFALAVLLSLLIAGVNFAGLAIIAGALSVGIGFGLQNIVNNFVSGIVFINRTSH